jgi:hypothetical protein
MQSPSFSSPHSFSNFQTSPLQNLLSSVPSLDLQTFLSTFFITLLQLSAQKISLNQTNNNFNNKNKIFPNSSYASLSSFSSSPHLCTIYHSKTNQPIIRILSHDKIKKPPKPSLKSPSLSPVISPILDASNINTPISTSALPTVALSTPLEISSSHIALSTPASNAEPSGTSTSVSSSPQKYHYLNHDKTLLVNSLGNPLSYVNLIFIDDNEIPDTQFIEKYIDDNFLAYLHHKNFDVSKIDRKNIKQLKYFHSLGRAFYKKHVLTNCRTKNIDWRKDESKEKTRFFLHKCAHEQLICMS